MQVRRTRLGATPQQRPPVPRASTNPRPPSTQLFPSPFHNPLGAPASGTAFVPFPIPSSRPCSRPLSPPFRLLSNRAHPQVPPFQCRSRLDLQSSMFVPYAWPVITEARVRSRSRARARAAPISHLLSPISPFLLLTSSFLLLIERTLHPHPRLAQHMRVNLRRRYILVPHEFLYGSDVIPCFNQMRRETVP